VLRWICATVVALVLSGFALLLLSGQYVNEGAVIVSVTRNHGLHEGDLFVMGGWALAMLAVGGLLGSPRRRRPDRAEEESRPFSGR